MTCSGFLALLRGRGEAGLREMPAGSQGEPRWRLRDSCAASLHGKERSKRRSPCAALASLAFACKDVGHNPQRQEGLFAGELLFNSVRGVWSVGF